MRTEDGKEAMRERGKKILVRIEKVNRLLGKTNDTFFEECGATWGLERISKSRVVLPYLAEYKLCALRPSALRN